MKKNILTLKATSFILTLLFLTACETGMKNKKGEILEAPSGIVNKSDNYIENKRAESSIQKSLANRIFSKSATPGYYLQVGFFKNYKPNATFMSRIKGINMPYTILLKNGNYHALIGPYKSYNLAKDKKSTVPASLEKNPFVIEVIRP